MNLDLPELARRAGKYRQPRFTAPEIKPTRAQQDALQRIYMRVVRAWQSAWQETIRPRYEATLAEGVRDSPADVSGAADEASNALNRLVVSLGADLSGWTVEIEKWHRGQFAKSFTPVGAQLDMFLGPGDVGPTLQTALDQNTSLIRSLNDQMRNGVSGAVFRGLQNRTPARDVAREIRRQAGIGQARAELIAADQLQKLTGRLDQARQEQMGLSSFEWAHSQKAHPRDYHVARNHKVFRWDSLVGRTDPPGFAIRCGCRARAVVDLDAQAAAIEEQAPEPVAPPPPPPPPAPARAHGYRSVRNEAVTLESLAPRGRLAVQKELRGEFSQANAHPEYSQVPEFADRRAVDFGNAVFSKAWTDEGVSAIAAIKPELDSLADQIGVPRVRGFKTVTGRQNADMGDGVMGLNPRDFNARAAVAPEELDAGIMAQAAVLRQQAEAISDELAALRPQLTEAIQNDRRLVYAQLREQQSALYKRHEAVRRKLDKLADAKYRTRKYAEKREKRSEWKTGDSLAARPWSVAEYQLGIDKVRSTLFHEFGHHVHQMLGKVGPMRAYGRLGPPMEQKLRRLWTAEPVGTGREAQLARQASTYATSNYQEWFAENFSLFVMGRRDLVDPVLDDLIEGLFNGRT